MIAPSLWPMRWRSTGSDAGNWLAAKRIALYSRGTCFTAAPGVRLSDTQLNAITWS